MSPTITVASFFPFFFVRPQNVCVVDTFYRTTKVLDRQTGSAFKIVQRVPPFSYSIFIVRYKTGRDYRVSPLSFFRHCATFFENFFVFKFFDILQQTEVSKSPKGPFQVFRHYKTGSKFLFFDFSFSKIFQCLTRVPPSIFKSPLQFFKILAT